MAGGAAVATGVVLLVLGHRGREQPRALTLVPLIAPGAAAFALMGRY